MLRNLSKKQQLSGLGVLKWSPINCDWIASCHRHHSCLDSCHCTHCAPHYKSTTLGLLWVPMLPQCVPSILPPYLDSMISPQMGEGRVLLTNKVTLGLVGWAGPTFYQASPGGWISSHVGLCNECALDSRWQGCKVGDYIMMGVFFMVTMTGFRYERDSRGTKLWPVGCGQNTTGQAPKLCGGGRIDLASRQLL